MKKTLICIDRDGTLIYDEKDHLFLGRDNDWPAKVRILPGVIDGLKKLYFLCPHASPEYVSKKPGVNFDPKLVHDCKCLKPSLDTVLDALKAENITTDNANVYVIGDRASDVLTAVNINGFGVLIPFENEPGEEEKVSKLSDRRRIFIAGNMIEAAEFVFDREARSKRCET